MKFICKPFGPLFKQNLSSGEASSNHPQYLTNTKHFNILQYTIHYLFHIEQKTTNFGSAYRYE